LLLSSFLKAISGSESGYSTPSLSRLSPISSHTSKSSFTINRVTRDSDYEARQKRHSWREEASMDRNYSPSVQRRPWYSYPLLNVFPDYRI